MSGNKNWRCGNCNYNNFSWRQQCNRCTRMKKGGSNDDGGFGVGTTLLVGAGAAAVGFLAKGLWDVFQGSSSSSDPPRPPAPSSGAGDVDNAARKKGRDAFRSQDIPKEMKCAVCLVNPREVCMLPCNHVILCEDCAGEVKNKCPMCQLPIESKK